MSEEELFYTEAFSRNIGLLREDEQEKLRRATVAVAGLGGVGGIFALSLARLGIGRFHIADSDSFARVNINRQQGALTSTLGKSKTAVMEAMIKDINPFAHVETFSSDDSASDAFLEGVDVVADAIDFFVIGARRALYRKARERGITVLSAGPIGFGSSLLVFDPKGMSFEEYFDIRDDMNEEEMTIQFGLGITPSLLQRSYFKPNLVGFKEHQAPSLVTGTLLAANFVTCAIVKLLIGRGAVRYVPEISHFDPFVGKYRITHLRRGNRALLQRLKKWYFMRTLQ